MKRPDLAIFLPSLAGGGAERVMVDLANGFVAEGRAVDLVLAQATGPYIEQLDTRVRLVDLHASRVSLSALPLVRYLRRVRPATLLSALSHANVIAYWANRLAGGLARLVLAEQNNVTRSIGRDLRSLVLRVLLRHACAQADCVVAVSRGLAEDISNSLRIAPEKITTIYNPVDLDSLATKMLATAPVPRGAPIILAAGRLIEQKDYPTLLRAFALLRETAETQLVILGEGPLLAQLEALAAELRIADAVSFHGFQSNPYAYMRAADVFVLSSSFEGFGNVLVEALACGTPVVSTDCPNGPAEILDHGRWGKLVPVGDHVELARALAEALMAAPRSDLRQRAEAFSLPVALARYERCLWPTV